MGRPAWDQPVKFHYSLAQSRRYFKKPGIFPALISCRTLVLLGMLIYPGNQQEWLLIMKKNPPHLIFFAQYHAEPALSASAHKWGCWIVLKGIGLLSNRAGSIHPAQQCQPLSVANRAQWCPSPTSFLSLPTPYENANLHLGDRSCTRWSCG